MYFGYSIIINHFNHTVALFICKHSKKGGNTELGNSDKVRNCLIEFYHFTTTHLFLNVSFCIASEPLHINILYFLALVHLRILEGKILFPIIFTSFLKLLTTFPNNAQSVYPSIVSGQLVS